jgi:phosphatidate cytidylyltransferase
MVAWHNLLKTKDTMLVNRLLVAIVLLPVGAAIIILGGIPFTLTIALFMGLSAWEYVKLFQMAGYQPSGILVIVGAVILVLARAYDGFASAPWIFALLVLICMVYHLLAYERGRDQAATDFNISLGGIAYLGWIGAYLVSLRFLPEGKWWFFLAMPIVWLADAGAYFIGTRYGKHKLSKRLSPRKSWEGYMAGIVTGVIGGALLGALWAFGSGPGTSITPFKGVLLGIVLSILAPLGDLGESMVKRQVGAKDSSNLLPGHGGIFDRVDSWLWGGVIGYYMIVCFFL